nr:immunoglobulin light chain junction region [Macaca mulatta]MOX18030.1 immunoglobulin light chain junction region [Macaca mulatta]MOX18357.1 immunoglobulin light chain junction region [Macaca mulatta]MOX20325.1 immunoglobulin light chain junction region [Macaca mulatta]MOX21737.1 immunoglobulin light chain junction region [Macaca mulatta]
DYFCSTWDSSLSVGLF